MDYYQNLTEADFTSSIPLDQFFSRWHFHYMKTSFDLYFAGVRRTTKVDGVDEGSLPSPESVAEIADLMPVSHRAVRLPLRLAQRTLQGDRYQDFAVAYWTRLDRAIGRFASR